MSTPPPAKTSDETFGDIAASLYWYAGTSASVVMIFAGIAAGGVGKFYDAPAIQWLGVGCALAATILIGALEIAHRLARRRFDRRLREQATPRPAVTRPRAARSTPP